MTHMHVAAIYAFRGCHERCQWGVVQGQEVARGRRAAKLLMYCFTCWTDIQTVCKPPSLQHTCQSACSIHYALAAVDMISHLLTLSVITDDFG